MWVHLILTWLTIPPGICQEHGTITGAVVNASRDYSVVGGAEVVLQAYQDGQFIPIAKTVTDDRGQFLFDGPQLLGDLLLIGANRDGVYYPAERLRLSPQRSHVQVKLPVYDSMLGASPLVALRHDIVVRPEPGLLNITEKLLIVNESSFCYAGQSGGEKGSVTLCLGIPSNFEKVTFQKEFYGRRFAMIDQKLVTSIPWPPGERELSFTYVLPIEQQHQVFERPLDLPCSAVCLWVMTDKPSEISCNLVRAAEQVEDAACFLSNDSPLPAGHVICVEFGRLPVPFAVYGRWIAVAVLISTIMLVSLLITLRFIASRHDAAVVPSHTGLRGPHKRCSKQRRFAR